MLSKGKRKQKTFRKKIMRGGDDEPVNTVPAEPINPGFYGRNFLSEYINESDELYNKYFKYGIKYLKFDDDDRTKANRLISDLTMLRLENDTPEHIPDMEERQMFVKSMLLLDIDNSDIAKKYRDELDEIRKKNARLGENNEALSKTDALLHFVTTGEDLTPAPLEKPALEKKTVLGQIRNLFSRKGGKSRRKSTRKNKKLR